MKENKLIAEFIGWYQEEDRNSWLQTSGNSITVACGIGRLLEFHSSWDWLMPVVKKIRDMDAPEKESSGWYAYYGIEPGLTDPDIDFVYRNVIEFIKWYNEKN